MQGQVDVRSYEVRTEDGKVFRRNRKHLRTSVPRMDEVPMTMSASTGDHQRPRVYPQVPVVTPEVHVHVPVEQPPAPPVDNDITPPVRASSRVVKPPAYLKDFVPR